MSYTVDAVSKAIELLFLVAEEGGKGVTELAKRSQMTKARAFRLLATLEEGGLVQRHMPLATYSLGYRALIIGTSAQSQLSLIEVANSILESVGRECNESVLVRIRDGIETVCVAWWDAPHALRVHSQLGHRLPLYTGASGKLLLAHAPADLRAHVLSGAFEKFTPNTILTRAKLEADIEQILESGYSTSVAERTMDMVAVAAPVYDANGQVVASLSMTAPASRVPQVDLPNYVEIITRAAERFSKALGYVSSTKASPV